MKSIMPIQQRISSMQGFPLRSFAIAFVLSLLAAVFSGWQTWQMHNHFDEMSAKHLDLDKDIGRIMLLDEVLTMSARMAAATGDFIYEKRYDQFDPELTSSIEKVRADLPQPEIEQFIGEMDDANIALVKMERKAFALAHQGRGREATALLTSDEYMRLKKIYAGGVEKTVNAASGLIRRETQHLHILSLWAAAANVLGILVLLAAWYFAIRSARSWAAERRGSEDALRSVQEEMVCKEKLSILGQLSGSVGHELRNPLGVMSNAVYFLKTVLTGADEITKEYLDIIKKEIETSQRIIDDMLGFARTKKPQARAITVKELVTNSLAKCAIPGNVALHPDIPETLPMLHIDPLQMAQVLVNIITNAVQAIPGEGSVRLAARVARDEGRGMRDEKEESSIVPASDASGRPSSIAISVTDTGEGISPENMKKLFQPLFTTKAKGIGLGLVVCKNLVESNGGRVEVQSELGKGTTFTLILPVEENET